MYLTCRPLIACVGICVNISIYVCSMSEISSAILCTTTYFQWFQWIPLSVCIYNAVSLCMHLSSLKLGMPLVGVQFLEFTPWKFDSLCREMHIHIHVYVFPISEVLISIVCTIHLSNNFLFKAQGMLQKLGHIPCAFRKLLDFACIPAAWSWSAN